MSTQKTKILVRNVMLSNDEFPIVYQHNLIKETIDKMNSYKIGIACIVKEENMVL